MLLVKGTVISNKRLLKYASAEYHLLRILAPEIATSCRPGQFLMVNCGSDMLLRRPISVHSAKPDSGEIDLLFAVAQSPKPKVNISLHAEEKAVPGAGTRWLARRIKGDYVEMLGPLGNGFRISDNSNHILLIAGGIGIAPLQFLAEECIKRGKRVTLLIGERDALGIYPASRLPGKIEYLVATEDGSNGYKGKVTGLIPRYISSSDQVFACGPQAMYQAIARLAKTCKWHDDIQVSLEVRMGCGFGVCYGCSIKTVQGMKRVCRDGPVFNINDIIWQEVKL